MAKATHKVYCMKSNGLENGYCFRITDVAMEDGRYRTFEGVYDFLFDTDTPSYSKACSILDDYLKHRKELYPKQEFIIF